MNVLPLSLIQGCSNVSMAREEVLQFWANNIGAQCDILLGFLSLHLPMVDVSLIELKENNVLHRVNKQ